MLIGHLPAGYLAKRAGERMNLSNTLLFGVLAGSILPDLDMLWFLLVDHGTVHHHTYLTHRPAIWAAVLLVGVTLRNLGVIGVGLGALLHMCLDTIAGAIAWGWPIWTDPVTLVIVPATYDHWVISFILHWTFAVELLITCLALGLFFHRLKHNRTP